MTAGADTWKHLPFGETTPIPYHARFYAGQYERIANGLTPKVMEDKWFICMDEPHLNFYRSWTGFAVYRVTFAKTGEYYEVTDAQCASEMLDNSDAAYQAQMVDFLISVLLLETKKAFPIPTQIDPKQAAIYQHHHTGTGLPIVSVPSPTPAPQQPPVQNRPWWKFWA